MHGAHPFEGPFRVWWGRFPERSFRPLRETDKRNLIHPVDEAGHLDRTQMFRAGGAIDADGIVDRTELHQTMAWLSELLKDQGEPGDTDIPAGYTYLLQFIAHDMIDSVIGVEAVDGGLLPTRRNARVQPLLLDTLYGSGPDEVPHAYALDVLPLLDSGFVPRVRLRVGRRRPRPGGVETTLCPFRDLARGSTMREWSEDEALERPIPGTSGPLRTEAFVADARNDSHALVAQLTLLFALLHNEVVRALREGVPRSSAEDDDSDRTRQERALRERSYREFLCARLIVTDIYRAIIFEDVLPRVLDRRILERYQSERKPLLGEGEGVPLEFSFGAFRFGHSHVRAAYRVNSRTEHGVELALRLSSARQPDEPTNDEWMVDWRRFFFRPEPLDPREVNFARRLTTVFCPPLSVSDEFAAKTPSLDTVGLMNRDLLSSSYAGLLSVQVLASKLAGIFGDSTLRPLFDFSDGDDEEVAPPAPGEGRSASPTVFDAWRKKVLAELTRLRNDVRGRDSGHPLLGRPLEPYADDPPLPFFVLFEAQYGSTVDKDGRPEPIEGRHLGPIGSIIVAETFYRAAAASPLTHEAAPNGDIGARLDGYARKFFPESRADPRRPERAAEAIKDLKEIFSAAEPDGGRARASMLKLLAYLERHRVFER